MIQDHDGTDIYDALGEKVGTVERSYDDSDGQVQLVEVKIGALFHKHRFVPVTGSQQIDDGLQVPYTKTAILDSPDASEADGELTGSLLQAVRGYYEGAAVPMGAASEPVTRDDDDGEDADDEDAATASADGTADVGAANA